MDNWIQIFRTGRHTDSAGKTREWTDKDLAEIVSSYDPANHEAPIVIGHPETDSPAYGWVESLKVEGGKLLAKVKDVADEFRDWVSKGLYKKVSIALYPDLSLRHVGFLGATPPSVKGLANVHFQEKEGIIIYSDFEKGGMKMGNLNVKDPMEEISRRIKEVMRNPRSFVDKRGRRFDEGITYSEALNFVQIEDPELAQQFFESLRPVKLTEKEKKSLAAGAKIVDLINAKMKGNKALSYSEALTETQKENRELILEYLGK